MVMSVIKSVFLKGVYHMKTVLKTMLIVIIASIVFMIGSAIVPYSEAFTAATSNSDPSLILFLFLNNLWLCATIIYIVKHSKWEGKKLLFGTMFVLFMVYCFMTQIETWFFGNAFEVLTKMDIILIMITNFIPILVSVPLSIRMFRNEFKNPGTESLAETSGFAKKVIILGLIYVVVYFVFGYFVAWQFKDVRVFYSGNPVKTGFVEKLILNYKEDAIIYPFQFLRGVLFTLSIMPLVYMMKGKGKALLISLCLVYLSPAVALIIPNVLFPDTVRWAHFIEMVVSMFCFAVISWYVIVYNRDCKTSNSR